MSEAELIARIRELFPRTGDDAAVVGDQVITNDMLIEDVDFTRQIRHALPFVLASRDSLATKVSSTSRGLKSWTR